MIRRGGRFAGLVLAAVLAACSANDSPDPPPYVDNPRTPRSVLSNFILAYEAKDIERYRSLFTDDFEFVFQDSSLEAQRYPDGWTVEQDSVSTLALFRDGGLESIRIAMVFAAAETTLWESDSTLTATSSDILLDVDYGGLIRRVSDEPDQEFHLVRGREAMGENPEVFYIRAWRERPFAGPDSGLASTAQVETATWGGIKASYAPADEPEE